MTMNTLYSLGSVGDALGTLLLTMIGMSFYAVLLMLSAWYARVTQWQPPAGNQSNDWRLRQRIGISLGSIALIVCIAGASIWQVAWQVRLLTILQAALLAAAGASDMQRFHLPLPITLLGAGLAVLTLFLVPVPPFYLFFGVVWVIVIIVLHALVSKGSMQLGDHVATVWIALAAPANGLLAIALGDAANVIFARIKGLKGRKVAAAGAWLLFATALAATPPYFLLFSGEAQTFLDNQSRQPVPLIDPTPGPYPRINRGVSAKKLTPNEVITATLLLTLANDAGDHTASVAFVDTHAGRVKAAKEEASQVSGMAQLAHSIAPSSTLQITLSNLAYALNTFNLEAIRSSSQQLADERVYLTGEIGKDGRTSRN